MDPLIWISGASGGIGQALARTVPWSGARVIGISRSPAPGIAHLAADLADPASWPAVGESFRRELAGFDGDLAIFIHAAGTLDPIGFAGEVPSDAYATNVLLNSASPQVLGHLFVAAVREAGVQGRLVVLTSGAAKSVYPGWSSYGAAKAAVDQWVRDVGAEQDLRGGRTHVLAIAPGTVDTGMQEELRATSPEDFPGRQKFVDLHAGGKLADPDTVARDLWAVLEQGLPNGSVVDLRDLAKRS
ncbi:MAG: SDR family NAD(P)-dependent oxidoreductase [Actinomycetota bacterium]